MKLIFSFLKILGTATLMVIGAYQWFQYEVKQQAIASAETVERKIMAIRSADMEHINSRFNVTDNKLDNIFREIIHRKEVSDGR